MPDVNRNEIVEPTQQIPVQLEGMSKIAAATTVAQTLSYSTERKFLDQISNNEGLCHLELVGEINHSLTGFKWLRVEQVGNFAKDSKQNCFEAMQTILHSCQLPNTQLAFLILFEDGIFKMYLGLKNIGKMNGVQKFITSNWKGVVTKKTDETDTSLRSFVNGNDYNNCYAFTGVPTINAKDSYAQGINQIVSGLQGQDKAAYLVLANPVSSTRIDGVLNTCREIQSQTESFKNFSLTENIQQGKNSTFSKTTSQTITETITQQVGNANGENATRMIVGVTGLAIVTALIYPPALALVPAAAKNFDNAVSATANIVRSMPRLSGAINALQMGESIHKQCVAKGLIPKSTPQQRNRAEANATTESDSYGYSESYSKSISQTVTNAHVEAVVEHIKRYSSRMEEGKATGMWEVGCYLFTSVDDKGSSAMQVKSVLSGMESVYEPIRVHDVSLLFEDENSGSIEGFVRMPLVTANYSENKDEGYLNEAFIHPFGEEFSHLTTLLTTKELSCYVNFPTSSLPGISVNDVWPDFSMTPQGFKPEENIMTLGHLLYNRKESEIKVGVPVNTFCRHALVVGVNGSGKTNTVLGVLDGFLKEEKPLMVIEPAKTEYVDWAVKYNKHVEEYNKTAPKDRQKKPIRIFIPGCDFYAKGQVRPDELYLNPFEVIRINENYGYKVLSHIDKLKSVLAAAFPTQEILPTVIERLLYKIYIDKMWITEKEQSSYPDRFPTLTDINNKCIKDMMVDLGYAEENTMNISAAIRTRFNSMKYGWKRKLLNNERLQGLSWKELFDSPCIVNLSYAGDDSDKAFIMALLLQFLYEYRQAESEVEGYSFNDNICKHLVVVEEAHRVMLRCDSPELPQYRSNQMFANILSEVRAYGQGVMIVDQVPSRLIEDAIKNTNIKVIHKIVAADDFNMIGQSIGLTDEQQKVIPKLSIGQAILAGLNSADVMSANAADIFLAKINENKKE